MFWFVPVLFALFITLSHAWHEPEHTAATAVTVSAQQRASQTIVYLNAINDYLYDHPQTSGTVDDSLLGVTPPAGCKNLIQSGRLYVYQPDTRGLMYQLKRASDDSALLGRVVSGRIQDNLGVDMGVSVPSSIANGDVVYLN
ncbi:hypothetical protein DP804_19890 [Salmonella enterica subsp. enterica]|nr:hypothetical protein [Salmonella enterica subsp. enterica serovar Virchow]